MFFPPKIQTKPLPSPNLAPRHSQTEIETKVASFRSLLLRQVGSVNNNNKERKREVTEIVLADQLDNAKPDR